MVKVHGCLIVYENNNPITHLLDSQTYYPLGMLIEVSKEKQDVTDKLLTNLFDETIPIKEYAENFEPSEAFMMAVDEYIDFYIKESNPD